MKSWSREQREWRESGRGDIANIVSKKRPECPALNDGKIPMVVEIIEPGKNYKLKCNGKDVGCLGCPFLRGFEVE